MILTNARIIVEDKIIEQGSLIINQQTIVDILPDLLEEGIDLLGMTIFPGFIDTHLHGTDGADFMDASLASNHTILQSVLQEGVTGVLATTMTDQEPRILKALNVLGVTQSHHAKLLGIHLEGPFLNKTYAGAQNEAFIIQGSNELFDRFNHASNQTIRLVTLAPEQQSQAFLKHLIDQDIIVSVGHSNATYQDMQLARSLGIHRVTHCYNAMRGLHHRELGVLGAALHDDDFSIELIADDHHVSKPALAFACACKQPSNIQLVTDAIRAKRMPEGTYELANQRVHVHRNRVETDKGVLAGSVLSMNDAAKNFQAATHVELQTLAKMLSTNQADMLGLTTIGRIKKGNTADLAILTHDFKVAMTIVDGNILYQNEDLL